MRIFEIEQEDLCFNFGKKRMIRLPKQIQENQLHTCQSLGNGFLPRVETPEAYKDFVKIALLGVQFNHNCNCNLNSLILIYSESLIWSHILNTIQTRLHSLFMFVIYIHIITLNCYESIRLLNI